jgi:hypothetical protein
MEMMNWLLSDNNFERKKGKQEVRLKNKGRGLLS